MATVGSAFVEILPSARGFARNLQQQLGQGAGAAGGNAGSQASQGFRGSFLSGMGSIVKTAGALLAGVGIANFFKGAIEGARETQKIEALTAQVIKTTGGAAQVTAEQVGELAGAIAKKTGIDDAAIQAGENLLLTFTNVRNEAGKGNDIFNQATQIMTDMSAALGTDAKGSAIQLGKALNDPIKGVSALSKVGVSFTQQQKDQIKTLVESGDTMSAQKIILAELNKEFGGAAEAQATAGDKAAFAWGEFQESIGAALLPLLDKLFSFLTNNVIPAVQDLASWISSNIGPAFATAKDVIGGVIGALVDFGGWVVRNRDWLLPLAAAVVTLTVAMTAGTVAAKIAAIATAAWTTITTLATSITTAFRIAVMALNLAIRANPIGFVVTLIATLVAALITAWHTSEGFRNVVVAVWNAIKTAFSVAINAVKTAVVAAWTFIRNLTTSVWNGIKGFFVGVWNGIRSGVSSAVNAVKSVISGAWNAVRSFTSGIWNGIKNTIVGVWNSIVDTGKTILSGISNIVKGAFEAAIGGIKAVINGIISAINTVAIGAINILIDGLNLIPFVDIPHVPKIPLLAEGGIITATPGGTLAVVGEGREDEAVIPLSKLESLLPAGAGSDRPPTTINVYPAAGMDETAVARSVDRLLAWGAA